MSIHALNLRFRNDGVERGFVKNRTGRLGRRLLLVGATLFLASITFLVSSFVLCGNRPCNVQMPAKASKRLGDVILGAIGLFVVVAMAVQRRRPFLTERTLELFAALVSYTVLVVGASGELAGDTKCATYLLLFIDTCLTVSHITLPIRWCLLWPSEVFGLLVYPVWAQIAYEPEFWGMATPPGHLTVMALVESMWDIAVECSERDPAMRPEMLNVMLHMSGFGSALGWASEGRGLPALAAAELQPWDRGAIALRSSSPIQPAGRGRQHRAGSKGSKSPGSSRELSLGRVDEDLEAAFDGGPVARRADPRPSGAPPMLTL